MNRLETLQRELEQNTAALRDITAKRNTDGSFPPDVQEQIKRANDEYTRIKGEMETELIVVKMEKEAALLEFHERAKATTTTATPAAEDMERTYARAFWKYHLRARMEDVVLTPEEQRLLNKRGVETRGTSTQITTSDSLGGYLVPTQFSGKLEDRMKWFANMQDYCQLLDDREKGGGTLEYPTGDDTSNTGNINTAANQAAQRTVSDMSFGQVLFNDWLIDSNIVKISRSTLQDERVGLVQDILARRLGERIGRTANAKWTNGTGTSEPYGLTTTVTVSAGTTTGATAITKAELVKFQASIDYGYQRSLKFGWMMHQSMVAYLRTLDFSTDTTHIFVDGNIAKGEPATLLGAPIYVNNDLPAANATTGLPVTATKHIYVGDFDKFAIRQIRDVSIERNDYLYWDSLTVGFLGWMRTDSNLLNANAIKSILQA